MAHPPPRAGDEEPPASALRSPLAAAHARAGATMTGFAGWEMPLRFGSELAEHAAVRTRAGAFDLSHMGQLEVHGPDAARLGECSFVSRIANLEPGRARYTIMVGPDGGIVDDLIVYRLAADDLLIVCNAANRVRVGDRLAAAARRLRATVVDRTSHRALIAVQGPAAARALAGLVPAEALTMRPFRCAQAVARPPTGPTVPVLLARTGYTGEDGYELAVPAASAVAIWEGLLAAGEPLGLVPCGLAARDSLRLEAGMALYGNELTEDLTPAGAGLGRLVDLGREFVGRAALVERAGETTSLVALAGEGRRAARPGDAVLAGGRRIGRITSGALSPTLGHPIAFARCERPVPVGSELTVDVRGREQVMRVREPPFYRRP
ncbi:glycine cleavage system aminomethyltransferase GcvT [Pseudactinotalea sp. HY158]|uniref:glycine cleavage system aminomethyltransferase GcvT n=1 Tax=Pseudactinotalea sp. HY158 TaxID=2654547 RepID=UPI001E2B48B5|nr:glycine cleavage system aminomethyltransferase GcvT [Pseudactinotalea sp. HY158]